VKTKTKPDIRDFIDADAQVIATETFYPYMGHPVERGRYHRLSDDVVRQYPTMFAVVVPVTHVLREIER
jgi:hypothetical protein